MLSIVLSEILPLVDH